MSSRGKYREIESAGARAGERERESWRERERKSWREGEIARVEERARGSTGHRGRENGDRVGEGDKESGRERQI